MRLKSFIALACAMLGFTSLASAQEAIPPLPIAKTEFLLDAPTLNPGDTFWAGVRFTMPEGWHIYWQNPGDSGIPTSFKWTLPEGVTAGDVQWPTPESVSMSGLVNYGYSHEVVLPVPLTIAADTGENGITIAGDVTVKVDWLVCKETCIPESAAFTASLPQSDARAAQLLANARAKAPTPLLAKAGFAADDARVALTVPVSSSWKKPVMAEFIPLEDGIIPNAHTVDIDYRPGILTLNFPRGSADLPERWNGVLKLQWKDGQTAAHTLTAERQAQLPAPAQSLLVLLGLAFVGGLLLNIMPCVLPVLSLKALAIVKKSHAAPQLVRAQGLAYTAGVVLSFLAIAGAMLALKASGEAVGWGFQLQSVPMVATLAILMALVSLNMAGAFHLPPMLGHIMVTHDGLRGSFLTGVLAVAVATPCTAPFMATAVGATLTLAPALSLLIFAAMGVGLASPFLLISFWPAAQRLLPKPGHWMVRLRQILAIPMAATALWLFYVLLQLLYPTPMKQDGYHLITPVAYSERALADLRAQQKPVFVDATAAWCLTCKVNERVALRPERVQHAFKDQNITLMIADWTTRDDAIAAYLATFGRNGVPLYVYYPPGQPPVVLPQVLTPSLVLDAIKNESTQPHN